MKTFAIPCIITFLVAPLGALVRYPKRQLSQRGDSKLTDIVFHIIGTSSQVTTKWQHQVDDAYYLGKSPLPGGGGNAVIGGSSMWALSIRFIESRTATCL